MLTTVPLSHLFPQFEVSFPQKLLKMVATIEARFLALNSPNNVLRPGSARTRWGAKALPSPLNAIRGGGYFGGRRWHQKPETAACRL